MWPLPTTVGKVCKGSPSLQKNGYGLLMPTEMGGVEHPKVCGTGIFTDPSMAEIYGELVGKYSSPMEPLGMI